jgi:hypothetical protein
VRLPRFVKDLSTREMALIAAVLVLLVAFLVFQFVYVPLLRTREEYRVRVEDLTNSLDTMKTLAESYASDRLTYERMSGALRRKTSLSVLSYLESEARRAGVRDRIEYIRPGETEREDDVSTTHVEMKIDAIGMGEMILFLGNVEKNREGLVISYLRLKPFFRDRSKVDAVVRVRDVTVK